MKYIKVQAAVIKCKICGVSVTKDKADQDDWLQVQKVSGTPDAFLHLGYVYFCPHDQKEYYISLEGDVMEEVTL